MPEEKETNLENGQATATAASTPSKSKPQRQKTPNRRRQNDSDVAGGVGITGGGVVILPQQVLNELYQKYFYRLAEALKNIIGMHCGM